MIYGGECRAAVAAVPAATPAGGAGWQTVYLLLPAEPAPLDPWFLPRLTVFSLASETPRQPLLVRSLALTDASGRDWLHNGSFADGGARWFSSSDRNHLPWHAKNMALHLLVEQGLVGLLALMALTLAALAGLLGPLRRHPLAPALAGAIVGCWVVGAVDSVMDIPRVASWLLLLTTMALALHRPSRAPGRGRVA